jgi:hypothetical protein
VENAIEKKKPFALQIIVVVHVKPTIPNCRNRFNINIIIQPGALFSK